ncbi:hypothetical protein EDB87DRAFT_1683737 [Lactarius vividus]|nr:hypothetical protein EDB87DRAFT_1683737 [Lactarius vividus]
MPGSPVADISNTFGAAFVGLLVSTMLFGLTIGQAFVTLVDGYTIDQKALKFFIGFLLITETFHTVLCVYALYWYLILNFGNVESLDYNVWAMNLQTMISSIPGSAVQLFVACALSLTVIVLTQRSYYTRRIYLVSESIFFPIVIVALVVSGNSLSYFVTAKEFALKRFSAVRSLYWLSCLAMASAVLVDILVAGVMCWSLYRKKTGFVRTDSVIMTLMAYTINSGLLTSLLGTAMTVSYIITPSSLIPVAFFWIMGKCYVNSLLAMLNSRDYVREQLSTGNPDNASNLSSIRIEPLSEAYGTKYRQPGVSVTVHRSTTSDFAPNKSDHNAGPTFHVPEQV